MVRSSSGAKTTLGLVNLKQKVSFDVVSNLETAELIKYASNAFQATNQ